MHSSHRFLAAMALGLMAFGVVCPASFGLGLELLVLALVLHRAREVLPRVQFTPRRSPLALI